MILTIEHDTNFLDGRTPHPATERIHLPEQRLVTVSYTGYWSSPDRFRTRSFCQMLDLVNSLMDKTGYTRIDLGYEWMEVDLTAARETLIRHLQFGQAYNVEIRDEETARNLSAHILPETTSARHFIPEGDPLTEHTFDFGLLRMTEDTMLLFVTWDED